MQERKEFGDSEFKTLGTRVKRIAVGVKEISPHRVGPGNSH
jgi:hypothetical protein